MVRALRESGVTIVLTTHYIEEAEDMADRVGVISQGKIILVEDKVTLMHKLGKKQLVLQLQQPLARVPESLAGHALALNSQGTELTYVYDPRASCNEVAALLDAVRHA